MSLVVVPAATLVVLLAFSLYTSAISNLQTTQATAATARATMVRSWLDAAGRSLANEALAVSYVGSERCSMLAGAFLRRNTGFAAVQFFDDADMPCEAGDKIDAQRQLAEVNTESVERADYRIEVVGSKLRIVATYARDSDGKRATSVLVVDDKALREHLTGSTAAGFAQAALVDDTGGVVAAAPAYANAEWLPASTASKALNSTWRARDRKGTFAAYALAPVADTALAVLMRFNDKAIDAARTRLYVLCFSQLAMLSALAFVYAAAIRRDVVRWIEGIDRAARLRGLDPESRAHAPVAASMPRELRSVAEAFNAMTDHAIERQEALSVSLTENRALMLEMHHRIKNSLQVIQSYLALIRRAAARPEAVQLSRIEARVGVLAVAYRLALTPYGMRPIVVKAFMEEICAAAVAGLRRPRQRVAYEINWNGDLVVDRAIPLGLGLVEALVAAFSASDAGYVGVRLAPNADGAVELVVDSDAAPTDSGLPEKVMRGLANQLGASVSQHGGGVILAWRFSS